MKIKMYCSMISANLLLIVCAIMLNFPLGTEAAGPPNPVDHVAYFTQQPLLMNMSSTKDILISVTFNKDAIPRTVDVISVTWKTRTLSPQFNILSLDAFNTRVSITRKQLEDSNYVLSTKVTVHATYIGHALLQPATIEFMNLSNRKTQVINIIKDEFILPVTIVQFEGIWGKIFIVSVSILILISYINVGAQLDEDNIKLVVKKPKTLILGFIISVLVMPAIAWFVGMWLFKNQPLYRIGAFIFACCPAASASTLWTVMLKSDKELSVGLQIVSIFGALAAMPALLYSMESSLHLDKELYHHIRVPYFRLSQLLFTLLVALIIGWRLVSKNKRIQEISRKIFRPLLFSVLLFIIIFSSILYWHIFLLFDWNIALASLIVTIVTFSLSGILGHCINCDLDRGVAISITSAYKNSGIAFAVLLVAFDSPDTYIAYVPCLVQVLTTSLTLYLTYLIVILVNYFRRRGQPDVIQASTNGDTTAKQLNPGRQAKSNSVGEESTKSDENDEFIAMDVTDIEAGTLPNTNNRKPSELSGTNEPGEQISVKVIASDHNEEVNK